MLRNTILSAIVFIALTTSLIPCLSKHFQSTGTIATSHQGGATEAIGNEINSAKEVSP
jgi:hypothetical protein